MKERKKEKKEGGDRVVWWKEGDVLVVKNWVCLQSPKRVSLSRRKNNPHPSWHEAGGGGGETREVALLRVVPRPEEGGLDM